MIYLKLIRPASWISSITIVVLGPQQVLASSNLSPSLKNFENLKSTGRLKIFYSCSLRIVIIIWKFDSIEYPECQYWDIASNTRMKIRKTQNSGIKLRINRTNFTLILYLQLYGFLGFYRSIKCYLRQAVCKWRSGLSSLWVVPGHSPCEKYIDRAILVEHIICTIEFLKVSSWAYLCAWTLYLKRV